MMYFSCQKYNGQYRMTFAFNSLIFLLWTVIVNSFTANPLSSHSLSNVNIPLLKKSRKINISLGQQIPAINYHRQKKKSPTSLLMWSIEKEPTQPMLDMKTSINAFNGWYNKMEPVVLPVYDDVTDFTFSSPADNWPSSLDEEVSSMGSSQSNSFKNNRIPRPGLLVRKIISGLIFRFAPQKIL